MRVLVGRRITSWSRLVRRWDRPTHELRSARHTRVDSNAPRGVAWPKIRPPAPLATAATQNAQSNAAPNCPMGERRLSRRRALHGGQARNAILSTEERCRYCSLLRSRWAVLRCPRRVDRRMQVGSHGTLRTHSFLCERERHSMPSPPRGEVATVPSVRCSPMECHEPMGDPETKKPLLGLLGASFEGLLDRRGGVGDGTQPKLRGTTHANQDESSLSMRSSTSPDCFENGFIPTMAQEVTSCGEAFTSGSAEA